MLTITTCSKCNSKATAKDGDTFLCTKHWFEIYGGKNGKSKSVDHGHGRGRNRHDARGVVREAWRKFDLGLQRGAAQVRGFGGGQER